MPCYLAFGRHWYLVNNLTVSRPAQGQSPVCGDENRLACPCEAIMSMPGRVGCALHDGWHFLGECEETAALITPTQEDQNVES